MCQYMMFYKATSFDQDISSYVSKGTTFPPCLTTSSLNGMRRVVQIS